MTPDDVLNQYPGPVRLRRPATKALFIPALLVVLSAYMVFTGDPRGKPVAIVFGGLFILYAIAQHFRPPTIELTAWGFVTTDILVSTTKSRWRDVSDFTVVMNRTAQVQYFDKNDEGRWSSGARGLVNAYPFSAQEMAELMNAWRQRSLFG